MLHVPLIHRGFFKGKKEREREKFFYCFSKKVKESELGPESHQSIRRGGRQGRGRQKRKRVEERSGRGI